MSALRRLNSSNINNDNEQRADHDPRRLIRITPQTRCHQLTLGSRTRDETEDNTHKYAQAAKTRY